MIKLPRGALDVVFVPVKKARRIDAAPPEGVLLWNDPRLPLGSYVWSRSTRTKPQYALICASDEPLADGDLGVIDLGMLCNFPSGKRLGDSQNTALVRPFNGKPGDPRRVIFRARLIEVLALRNPVALSLQDHCAAMDAAATGNVATWLAAITEIKRKAAA